MLFKEFDDDATCNGCGKRLVDLASGKAVCSPCLDLVELKLANTSSISHFTQALSRLWSFDFTGMVVHIMWAVQRLTRTGDYGENGVFTRALKKAGRKRP